MAHANPVAMTSGKVEFVAEPCLVQGLQPGGCPVRSRSGGGLVPVCPVEVSNVAFHWKPGKFRCAGYFK